MFALAGFILAFSVSWLDQGLFHALDRGGEPIRVFISDQHYYLLRAHRLFLEGRPLGGAYFYEHLGDAKRFAVFETLLLALGRPLVPLVGANPAVWAIILRAAGVFGLFAALSLLLRRWAKLGQGTSIVLAALIAVWFELRIFYMGNGLTAWHLPFALAGLWAISRGLAEVSMRKRLAWLVGATLCFLLHPIAFGLGVMTIAISLIVKRLDGGDRGTWPASLAWLAVAVGLGFGFYGRFALHASTLAGETLSRNLYVPSRLPALPMTSLWFIALALMIWLLGRRAAPEDRAPWIVLFAATAAGVTGLNLNVVTGAYFLNDHYGFMLPLMPPLAAALAFRLPPRRPKRAEAVIIAALVVVFAAWFLAMLGDPVARLQARGLEYFGTFLSLAMLVVVAFGRWSEPSKNRIPAVLAVIGLGLAFAAPVFYMIDRLGDLRPLVVQAEGERPVIDALRGLPPGVVLSDPAHAETVAAYTAQLPYWSALAFGDDAPFSELTSRWRDALRFFPDDPKLNSLAEGERSLYGHMDLMCNEAWTLVVQEHGPYRLLHRLFGFKNDLCRPAPDAQAWDAYIEANRPTTGQAWTPAERLDYLLVDIHKEESVPVDLTGKFTLLKREGPIEVYRYVP